MKRLIIAATSLALIAGCGKNPTSNFPAFSEPFGTLTFDIGPELIEVTQVRLMSVDTVFLGRNPPGISGSPEFAPLLHEALAASGESYDLSISQPRVDCIVTMAVDGGAEVEMRLTICDALLSHPNWIP